MYQSVDSTGETYEYAEIRDRLDLAADLVAAVVIIGEFLPRIGLALLHAQADAATLLVDVQHHDFDFLADMHHLGWIDVLVGPVHFRDVHQALYALFDFHEAAVVRDVGDLAEQAGIRRIAPRNVLPRVCTQLLQAQRHTLALAIELQNPDIDLLADFDHLGRMLDALPGHVGDVQQSINAAKIDERAIIGEVLHHALDCGALLQIVEQRRALGAVFLLNDGATRYHHVVALLVELDDFEFERLVLQVRWIAHRANIHQGARQECADVVDLDGKSAFDPTGDDADDDLLLLESGFQARPGSGA